MSMTEQERFDRCLGAVLRFEGGYCDNPLDAGGPTNLGVTIGVLSQALGRAATVEEVRALTPAGAAPIYREHYWRLAGCDRLPAGLDLLLFDTAVNMGPETAVRMLQGALGARADGEIGARTLAAAHAARPHPVIARVAQLRGERYRALAGFPAFGRGWLKRLETVRGMALDWAGADAPLGDAA
jgi:lysozyme family protein